MITGPASSASASAPFDHDIQAGSLVKRSSRTLASTRVPPGGDSVLTASERHDLLGGHLDGPLPNHPLDDFLPPARPSPHQARTMPVDLEVDLAAGCDPEPLANVLGNRHLTLARNAHSPKLAQSDEWVLPPSLTETQTAETCSSSATRKDEPQPHAATTLGLVTLKPAPCRLSS